MNEKTCLCVPGAHGLPGCPVHGFEYQSRVDLHDLIGLRTAPLVAEGMLAADIAIGRVIQAEPVLLCPARATRQQLQDDVADQAPTCACDLPAVFGHDTGCDLHPAPILADPLQLLVAAIQLITDQPTTEQWQTIKQAIARLVPSPFRSHNAD